MQWHHFSMGTCTLQRNATCIQKGHFVFVCGRLHERINASHYNVSKKNGNQKQLPVAMASILVFRFSRLDCRRFRLISFVSWFALNFTAVLKQVSPSQEVYNLYIIDNQETLRYLFQDGHKTKSEREDVKGWAQAPSVVGTDLNYYKGACWKIIPQDGDKFILLYSSKHNCCEYQLQQHAGLRNHWNSANLLLLRASL